MNHQKLIWGPEHQWTFNNSVTFWILNLPANQDPSERLTNLFHHQDHLKLQFDLFRTLDYHLNNTGTHQNPTAPFSLIKNPLGTITLPYKDFITFSKDDFLFRKMLGGREGGREHSESELLVNHPQAGSIWDQMKFEIEKNHQCIWFCSLLRFPWFLYKPQQIFVYIQWLNCE